jgi:hypothetical protein
MPRSSRSNPVDLVVDHEYGARIAAIKVSTSAGSALGTAFGNHLASGNNEKLGAGIMKGLKDKADRMESPIRKVGTKKKTVAVPDAPKKASTACKSKTPPKAIPMAQKI